MTSSRNLLRSAQFPAILLLIAAGLGLLLANTPAHDAIDAALHAHLAVPFTALDLSISHWISDGLLAVFFLVAAIELRHELTRGELSSFRTAIQPAIAAAGGVIVPIVVYLAIAGGGATAVGWPIPTATDIAFALGVLAVFGRGLPSTVRVFLLALAILDDIIGIVFIAVLFAHDLNVAMLLLGLVGVAVFAVLTRMLRGGARIPIAVLAVLTRMLRGGARIPIAVLAVLVALLTWSFVALSGVHATIAGVMLGLVMAPRPADRTREALEPWVNGLILPVFAFAAAFVVIPAVAPSGLSPAFFGTAIALPVGKIVGITLFGWIAVTVTARGRPPVLTFTDLLAAGALGGIGFTVSLLLANLAFADDSAVRDQAILGVLVGSLTALVISGITVSARARWYRRMSSAAE